jgi:hypothetical protein
VFHSYLFDLSLSHQILRSPKYQPPLVQPSLCFWPILLSPLLASRRSYPPFVSYSSAKSMKKILSIPTGARQKANAYP